MSRIGRQPIALPKGVEVTVNPSNEVKIKGPKGELLQKVDRDIKVKVENGNLIVERPTEQKRHKAMHGLYRSLFSNMVNGVTNGYTKRLELVGVGFKASSQGQVLELVVGFSHNILIALPKEIKVKTELEKGQNPAIILEGIDKQLIGQVAAKIRSVRPPEPYKGKGIKFSGEILRRKAGKTAAKAASA